MKDHQEETNPKDFPQKFAENLHNLRTLDRKKPKGYYKVDHDERIKGKNARNTTSGFSRAADAMKADTQSGGGSSRSSAGDGEISKGSK